MVVRIFTESLCDARHVSRRDPGVTRGAPPGPPPCCTPRPAAPSRAGGREGSRHDQGPAPWTANRSMGPLSVSADARAVPLSISGPGGGAAGVWCRASGLRPGAPGRMSGADPGQRRCDRRGTCPLWPAGRAVPRAIVSTGYGRLRASPEPTALGVTGLLSPADRSRTLGRGPTAYLQYATRSSGATRGFFEGRPWLARTPGPTKSPWARSRAVRVRVGPNADTPVQPRGRCGGLTGLTRGRGTAPAASWRARCRACRAHPGTGRGSPSRGRG